MPQILRPLLLLLALLAVVPPPARAAAAATQAATAAAPVLTPAEAQRVLAVLNDPAKRAAFTATLTDMAKAVRKTSEAAPAGLAPDSVGAEILLSLDGLNAAFAAQGRQFAHAFRDFRNFGPWLRSITQSHDRRAAVGGALLRLVAVLAVSLGVVAVLVALMRRPIDALARAAASRPPPPDEANDEPARTEEARDGRADGPEPPLDEAERQRRARLRHKLHFTRLLHAFRRVPFALLHFVFELVPVFAFALTAFLFELSGVVGAGQAVLVVRAAINSFVLGGLVVAIVYALLAPRHPPLRLILLTDPVAVRVSFWLRTMALVGAWGFAVVEVLRELGLGEDTVAALTKVLVFVEHTLLAVLFLRVRREAARRLQPPRRVRGAARQVLSRLARGWWVIAIFFDYAFWLVWAAQLRNGYARLWTVTLETILVAAAARLLSIALLGRLERTFSIDPDAVARHPWVASRSERYYPILRQFVGIVVSVIAVIALLQIWGLDAFSWFRAGALGGRVVSAVIGILAALVISVVVWESVNAALERHIDHLAQDGAGSAGRVARVRTLLPMLRIILMIFILTVLSLTVLSEIGVNIAPLLGGAGIVGVAIGFGSQKLVQDFITGIFLLLENTMQVGDYVTLAGLSGSVEHLSIRTIRLRAGDGSLHTIPFSSVSTVTNTNRGLGNAAVSIDLDPEEDTDRAGEVLKEIAVEMRADETFASGMLSDLQLWGVNAVSSQAVTLVGQIVCTDSGRWGVQREFNRRVKRRFQELGIRMAAPVQIVQLADRGERGLPAFRRPGAPAASPPPEDEPSTNVTESPPPSALGHDA